MRGIAILGLLISAPASAQQGATPQLQQLQIETRQTGDIAANFASINRAGDPNSASTRSNTSFERLKWDLCVLAAAPVNARAYVENEASRERSLVRSRLSPVFDRCDAAGRLNAVYTKRGAIRDALAFKAS
ncbi:hypothetical protein [Sphingomonas sp. RS2018]